jgi:hypothetical protein
LAYLSLAAEPRQGMKAVIDDSVEDAVTWVARSGQARVAHLPRVIFSR